MAAVHGGRLRGAPEGGVGGVGHLALDHSYEPGEDLSEPREEEKLYVLKEERVQLYVRLPDEGEVTLSAPRYNETSRSPRVSWKPVLQRTEMGG
jgi:hypothetical protein